MRFSPPELKFFNFLLTLVFSVAVLSAEPMKYGYNIVIVVLAVVFPFPPLV